MNIPESEITVPTMEGTFLKLFDIERKDNGGQRVSEKRKNKVRIETLLNLHYVINGKLDKVYIGPSRLHQNGVFAKRDISKGEIITFYPAHYVFETKVKKRQINPQIVVSYLNSDITPINDDIRNRYTYCITPGLSIGGDPKEYKDMTFVGHIVNDGISTKSIRYNKNEEELYNRISSMRNNSVYRDIKKMCVAIVAIADILKDEEILVSYSYRYWVEMNINQSINQTQTDN
jgi:SET domain-containing protein